MSGDGVDIKGLPDALAFIDTFAKTDLRGRLKEAAMLVRDEARNRTGSRRVRAALGYDVTVRSLTDYQASVGPDRKKAWFAHFLEFGTHPHQIARGARREQLLPSGRRRRRGHDILGSRIHPGARARPFLIPAAIATEDQVVDIVGKAFVYTGSGRINNP